MTPFKWFNTNSIARRVRYGSTWDAMLMILLFAECFLLASERFSWFTFATRKGFALLTALAGVAAIVLVMFLYLVTRLLCRKQFRFSLRSLTLLTLVIAILAGWLGSHVWQANVQREATDPFRSVRYDFQYDTSRFPEDHPPSPALIFVAAVFGVDFFFDVVYVNHDQVPVTADTWKQLRKLPRLRGLNFGSSGISDDGLKNVEDFPGLEEVVLVDAEVGDVGLGYLARLHGLRNLFLAGTKVTDEGLAHVAELTTLESLYLDRTAITDAGVARLAGLARLESLSVGGCTGITDVGIAKLPGLVRLRRLFVGDTNITDQGLKQLGALVGIETLCLGGTKVHALDGLECLTRLQSLNLSGTAVDDHAIAVLERMVRLQELDLSRTAITDVGLMQVGELQNLSSLRLADCKITDQGLFHLRGLTKLNYLVLDNTSITDAGLQYILHLPNLKNLHVAGSQISDEGIARIRKRLPECEVYNGPKCIATITFPVWRQLEFPVEGG